MGATTRLDPPKKTRQPATRPLLDDAATVAPEVERRQRLWNRVQQGDRDAFAQLIEEERASIFGYLRARLLEPADAEDLAQEVFLRCYTGCNEAPDDVAVRPWLMGIAKNLLREHARRQRRRREGAWTEMCLELDDLSADESPSEFDDALDYLPGCIQTLGPSARQALELRYHGEMRLAEIGVHLHRSEGAVKLMIHRARQALRYCLNRKLGDSVLQRWQGSNSSGSDPLFRRRGRPGETTELKSDS